MIHLLESLACTAATVGIGALAWWLAVAAGVPIVPGAVLGAAALVAAARVWNRFLDTSSEEDTWES